MANTCEKCLCYGFADGAHQCKNIGCIKKDLTPLETELLEHLKIRSMTFAEMRKINPKFLGAIGELKSKGLAEIKRLPNNEKHALWWGRE